MFVFLIFQKVILIVSISLSAPLYHSGQAKSIKCLALKLRLLSFFLLCSLIKKINCCSRKIIKASASVNMSGIRAGRRRIWSSFLESGTDFFILRVTTVGSEAQPSYLSLGTGQYSRDVKLTPLPPFLFGVDIYNTWKYSSMFSIFLHSLHFD